jgi:hypothetical protein
LYLLTISRVFSRAAQVRAEFLSVGALPALLQLLREGDVEEKVRMYTLLYFGD